MLRGSNYHSAGSLDLKSIPLYVYSLPKDAISVEDRKVWI